MGTNNKRRRADKRRRRQRASGQSGRPRQDRTSTQHQQHDASPSVEDVVRAAVWSWESDPPVHAELLDRLDTLAGRGEPVLATTERLLHEALDGLWANGWTPADVIHVSTRRLSAAHADVATEAIVADGRSRIRDRQALHPRWQAQLDMLDARRSNGDRARRALSGVRLAVTVLCLLLRLPPVPPTVPGPGSPDSALPDAAGLDQRMLQRVRALLAKAESTEFEQEAEALTAKAQELIARHAIADALLHTPDDVGEPSVRRMHLDDPYADAKAALLSAIADANRCSAVHTADFGWVTVFGYDRDLDAVELLGASLLTQATSAMVRHGARRDVYGRSTTRSFRRSFLYGFAVRIGERLRAATDGEVAAASANATLLPVLAARDDRLRAAQEAAFPRTTARKAAISNSTGWVAGQTAADLADLNVVAGHLPGSPGDARRAP